MKEFENTINTAWDNKDSINGQSDKSILDAINQTIELVDKGELRVAEKMAMSGQLISGLKKQ